MWRMVILPKKVKRSNEIHHMTQIKLTCTKKKRFDFLKQRVNKIRSLFFIYFFMLWYSQSINYMNNGWLKKIIFFKQTLNCCYLIHDKISLFIKLVSEFIKSFWHKLILWSSHIFFSFFYLISFIICHVTKPCLCLYGSFLYRPLNSSALLFFFFFVLSCFCLWITRWLGTCIKSSLLSEN